MSSWMSKEHFSGWKYWCGGISQSQLWYLAKIYCHYFYRFRLILEEFTSQFCQTRKQEDHWLMCSVYCKDCFQHWRRWRKFSRQATFLKQREREDWRPLLDSNCLAWTHENQVNVRCFWRTSEATFHSFYSSGLSFHHLRSRRSLSLLDNVSASRVSRAVSSSPSLLYTLLLWSAPFSFLISPNLPPVFFYLCRNLEGDKNH